MKKKNIILVFFVLCLTLILSCQENGRLKDSEVSAAKKLVLNKGDKFAYDDLYNYYEDRKERELLMPFSIVMSYRYNNAYTYFDIYSIMIEMYNGGYFDYKMIKNLDPQSRKFALDHLIKGAELGDSSSKKYLAKYYIEGEYLPQNIELGKKLQDEIKIY